MWFLYERFHKSVFEDCICNLIGLERDCVFLYLDNAILFEKLNDLPWILDFILPKGGWRDTISSCQKKTVISCNLYINDKTLEQLVQLVAWKNIY